VVRRKKGAVAALVTFAGLSFATIQAPAKDVDGVYSKEARASRALAVAQDIFSDSNVAGRSATAALADLAVSLPHLSGVERRQARGLLTRPDDPQDQFGDEFNDPQAKASPQCSRHFCVHWTAKGKDAPKGGGRIPEYVKETLKSAERSFRIEHGKLGWRKPPSDRGKSGNSKTDIFLKNIDKFGLYGYAATDPGQRGPRRYSYLVVDNDYKNFQNYPNPLLPLQVTMAHEYNHVIQFGYDVNLQGWHYESTATYIEDKVYKDINDYVLYMGEWVNRTEEPLTLTPAKTIKVYGSAIWNHFLASEFGDAVVELSWRLGAKAKNFSAEGYDKAIKKRGGKGFAQSFADFAAEVAELRASPAFPDSALYPDVERKGTLTPAGGSQGKLDNMTFALLDIPNVSGTTYTLNVQAPNGLKSAIALVGRTGGEANGQIIKKVTYDGNGGNIAVTLNNPGGLTRLTAVLVNADSSARKVGSAEPNYTKNNQQFSASITIG
jgi:hypothetical protein